MQPARDLSFELPKQAVNYAQLFEHIANIYFYVKDRESHWLDCNCAALELFNAADKSTVIGRCDRDFYPEEIAAEILEDDRAVVETGRPIVNKLEVIVDERCQLVWVSTTKIPAIDANGDICGLMGLTRVVDTTDMLPDNYKQFSKVIEHVRQHYRGDIKISDLARIACLSESQFRKRFTALLKISPQKFVTRVRLQTAARLLVGSDCTIVDVALNCGFCDQSYFTRRFSEVFGITPKNYRKRWRGVATVAPFAKFE